MLEAQAATAAKKAKVEVIVEDVKMSDGRTVGFAGNRKMLKEVLTEGGQAAVRFDWRNGNTRIFAVPPQHVNYAAGHGLGQKLGDKVASLKNEDGSPVDVDDMQLAVESLYERLEGSQDWNEVGEGGEGAAGGSILLTALMEVYGRTREQVKTFLADKTPKDKNALRESAKLAPVVQRLEAERKAKRAEKEPKVDTAAMLASLEGEAA